MKRGSVAILDFKIYKKYIAANLNLKAPRMRPRNMERNRSALNALAHIFSNATDKGVETFLVLLLNKPGERFHFAANFAHLTYGIRIKKDFAQEAVILAEHTAGDAQVPLEGCAGRVLMLHHCREDERGNEGDA